MKSFAPGTFHAWTGCHLRLYAWCNENMSTSLRFNPRHSDSRDFLKSVASDFGRSFLSMGTSTNTVTTHSDMPGPAWMPLHFIIYRMWHSGWARLRRGRVHWLLGYRRPWPIPQTAQTSLSWSPRHHLSWWVLCSREGRHQGHKGRQSPGKLPCWNLSLSFTWHLM